MHEPLPVTLRRASRADATAVRELMLAELGRGPTVARLREQLGRHPAVVATSGERLVGYLFSAPLAPDIIELGNLLVRPDHRNQGIGTAMIAEFEAMAAGTYAAVVLCTSDLWPVVRGQKRRSVPLYERNGYRELHSTGPSVLMIKELAPPP